MKQSNKTIKHCISSKVFQKKSLNQTQANVKSLKSIINQGKIPLSNYISGKATQNISMNNHNQTYFDKMKAVFKKKEPKTNLQMGQSFEQNKFPIKKRMQMQEEYQKSYRYLYKNEKNEIQTTKNTSISKHITEVKYNDSHKKERSKSMINYSKSKQSPFKMQQLFLNSKRKIVETKQSSNKTTSKIQIASSEKKIKVNSELNSIFRSKQAKRQTINYTKFVSLYKNTQNSVEFIQINDILGCGTNATVYLGKQKKNEILFAVKIYDKYKLIEPSKKKRVFKEIEILSKLNHPNIIKLTNSFEDKRQIHILFQYIPKAETLQDYIRRHQFELSSIKKVQFSQKIIQAVSYLHEAGISHRDIKTDNIIVNQDGDLKLIDFGFATTVARGQTHCGTPNYMAPQLFQKKNTYNPSKVDIWALGVLLYYLFEGKYPFKGYNQKDLVKNIALGNVTFKKCENTKRQLISSLLLFNPQKRPNASDILHQLKKINTS